jgi:hypothetical protein
MKKLRNLFRALIIGLLSGREKSLFNLIYAGVVVSGKEWCTKSQRRLNEVATQQFEWNLDPEVNLISPLI